MQNKAVLARNTDRAVAYEGPAGLDFHSDVIDFKEMNTGFIQVISKDLDAYDGSFQLFVSVEYCQQGDTTMFAPYGNTHSNVS